MKVIRIEFVKPAEFRLQSIENYGDYWETENEMVFQILDCGNPFYSLAILIHELQEKFEKDAAGISDAEVDTFDLSHPESNDPGWLEDAPYRKQHAHGDVMERMSIALSGNDWIDYEKCLDSFYTES
jgi:hypothetical protein